MGKPSHTIARRLAGAPLAAALALGTLVGCAGVEAGEAAMAPPGGDFQKVSDLVELPEFIPGLGTLYVDPATLPAGPFLAYDRGGELVSTIYMVPLAELNDQKKFADLAAPADGGVESVDLYYNAGHPGVDQPHYHIVLWHVPEDQAELK